MDDVERRINISALRRTVGRLKEQERERFDKAIERHDHLTASDAIGGIRAYRTMEIAMEKLERSG